MKNKGFTMIELVAVIGILGIIVLIAVPNMVNVLGETSKSLNQEQILALENAAREWGLKNLSLNGNSPSQNSVSIKTLRDTGFLERKSLNDANIKSEEYNQTGFCITYDNQFIYKFTRNINEC